jgi:gamma-glutamyltranspeptidase / glutathione hydrolase
MGRTRPIRVAAALVMLLQASGCSWMPVIGNDSGPKKGDPGYVTGFIGGVVADDPTAAQIGQQVLSAGGTAADAAVAVGFTLAVTLPSRAGLGGGGACLVYGARSDTPNNGVAEAVLFLPPAPAAPGGADRPAAAPMLARGLYLLHSKYGSHAFDPLLAPAERMARQGIIVSRALARDFSVVQGPLSADPGARSVFFPGGTPIAEGKQLIQPGLGATIARLRQSGIGDLYQGTLAHEFASAADTAGGGLSPSDLRAAIPRFAPALNIPDGRLTLAFLPPPADGGIAAAAAWQSLAHDPAAVDAAAARSRSVAAAWRQGGGQPAALLNQAASSVARLPALPASTTFLVLDRRGNAVACALTMNNLFGTGRVAPTTGILLAASPASVPPPLLSAAIAYDAGDNAFHAAVAGSGQDAAGLAAGYALSEALSDREPRPMPTPVPEPGRANVIACDRGLPGSRDSCSWATDPRGYGLALGQMK